MEEMIIEACLFINPDDCTELHWSQQKDNDNSDFDEYVNKGWIYLGLFDIEAGKINEMYCGAKSWVR